MQKFKITFDLQLWSLDTFMQIDTIVVVMEKLRYSVLRRCSHQARFWGVKGIGRPGPILLLLIVEAWRIRTFQNPVAHRYHYNFHVTAKEQEYNFYVKGTLYSNWLDWPCGCWERIRVQYCADVESVSGIWAILNSHWLVWSCDCRERIRVQYCSDVEIVFSLSKSFSKIGAQQDFEMPEFFMPQLLIK